MPDTLTIASTAIIHPRAQIGDDVQIGPYSVVGEDVRIGRGTEIGPHVILDGWTTIGEYCRIFTGAVIGSEPQDLKYKGGVSFVRIGDHTTIREYSTVNRGTSEGEETRVGQGCFLMAYSHIAHNCILEDSVIMASFAALAGHIRIESNAIIGGLVAIHQFCQVGKYAIVGGASAVRQDVLPYTRVAGNPCKPYGINVVGLRRHGFSEERMKRLKRIYRIMYRSHFSEGEALDCLHEEMGDDTDAQHIIEFVKRTERGICR
ncbi:MAG TPA: acyl-ACP--UDP-N-acetylglucosamine O-acyltransferase [bacterium]|nr:acyl-ACP--UDP-N-acetylglucosamine O-acyltransferase [bacterium]HQO35920.1 acyl-ACP--UDP-N-acetylglucosamine O-acyltransferase [bacterium]HQP98061.1 acyl-ACP--UDP-N-acetylglucosamine O-acyltransferase [bacterium]